MVNGYLPKEALVRTESAKRPAIPGRFTLPSVPALAFVTPKELYMYIHKVFGPATISRHLHYCQ